MIMMVEFIFGMLLTWLLIRALEDARESRRKIERLNRQLDLYKKQVEETHAFMQELKIERKLKK
jgi:uncharacterized membrane-anchored protein YhcB (DUF1043 family)